MADARVTDKSLNDAFQEGVAEGLQHTDKDDWVYLVGLLVDGKPINVKTIPYGDGFPVSLLQQHLANGPGQGVVVTVRLKSEGEQAIEEFVKKALSAVPSN